MSESDSVPVDVASVVSVPDPTLTQRGLDRLLTAIDEHNAKGEEIIDEENRKTLVDAYHITCEEEKEICLTLTQDEYLAYFALLRDTIDIANSAKEFLRKTREVVRQACEAQGMPEEEIVKRLRLDEDILPRE